MSALPYVALAPYALSFFSIHNRDDCYRHIVYSSQLRFSIVNRLNKATFKSDLREYHL